MAPGPIPPWYLTTPLPLSIPGNLPATKALEILTVSR